MSDDRDTGTPGHRKLLGRLRQAEARHRRAQAHGRADLWGQVAWVGSVGWLVALPIVGGALLGHLIDRRMDTGVRWALAGLSIGIFMGGYGIWRMVQEGRSQEEEDEQP